MEMYVSVTIATVNWLSINGIMSRRSHFLNVLSQLELISSSKQSKFESVAKNRIHTVQVLLEDIIDRGNENAITRTMDGLGVQHLHRLRHRPMKGMKGMKGIRTDKGSRQWVTINDWFDMEECLKHFKSNGFLLVGSDCSATNTIEELDLNRKMVIGFGNESSGLSDKLLEQCDVTFKLPMFGFVSSYNVSVSVGITLYHLTTHLRKVM